ncbi:MAG: hypothetical protein EA412_00800 [Chitinophagaceae bacterium]|nr:MAG: hypothetical protein EA412_00800 [Chitinophagaceae bacterium]
MKQFFVGFLYRKAEPDGEGDEEDGQYAFYVWFHGGFYWKNLGKILDMVYNAFFGSFFNLPQMFKLTLIRQRNNL